MAHPGRGEHGVAAGGGRQASGASRRRGAATAAAPSGGVALIGVDDDAWDASLVHARTSVFHTAGYHRYARGFGEGEPYLAVVEDGGKGIAWPYLLRSIETPDRPAAPSRTDVASVYGYPGPVTWGVAAGDAFLERALAQIVAAWRDQGAVSAFTRFNPLLENDSIGSAMRPTVRGMGRQGVVAAGHTVSIDLTLEDAGAAAGFGRDLGRRIRVARRAGLRTVHDEDWSYLDRFSELYLATMARVGAASHYMFGRDDFERLRRELPSGTHLLVTLAGDDVAAAGLFLEHGGTIEWHLVGIDQELCDLSPSKVLVADAIPWARARGDRVLHLGGGRGGSEDSLYFFKSRFSRRRHRFSTGRWIIDGSAYAELVSARRASLVDGDARLDPDYFPAYRAPVLQRGGWPVPQALERSGSAPGSRPASAPEEG